MDYAVTTAPSHEPVSIEQARRHLRVDGDQDDVLIAEKLRMAMAWSEAFTNRALLWQKIEGKLDTLKALQLPRPPLIAVDSITYIDTSGNLQTLGTDVYDVDTASQPGRIILAYDQTWPSVRGHHHDVTITFTAGYAAPFTRSGNTLVAARHRFAIKDFVQVYNIGGALPAGLSAGTNYYVASVSGTAITLATTEDGEAVTLSDAGTGTHYIDALPSHIVSGFLARLAHFWSHRGEESLATNRQLQDLLGMERMIPI